MGDADVYDSAWVSGDVQGRLPPSFRARTVARSRPFRGQSRPRCGTSRGASRRV